jgi:acetoin utilization deacetylase AcuC-like enzyme
MRIYATDRFELPLPPGHRFPVVKYARLAARVAAVAADLIDEAPAATDAELELAHDPAYVAAVTCGTLDAAAQRRIGLPWSAALVERSRRSAGATLAACRSALAEGCGVNLAGGTHHAHRGHGEGFCVFNDAAVALLALLVEGRIARAIVVDLDVHQGDGTAAIFAGDGRVFTYSQHGRDNFPFRKAASRLDVELADGSGDDAYRAALRAALPHALAQARPDLALYIAGADPYAGDRLGRLALTRAGLAARDAYVLDQLDARGIPVAIAMGGGYAEPIDDSVDIHCATVALALGRYGGTRVLDFPHRHRAKPVVRPHPLPRPRPADAPPR